MVSDGRIVENFAEIAVVDLPIGRIGRVAFVECREIVDAVAFLSHGNAFGQVACDAVEELRRGIFVVEATAIVCFICGGNRGCG